MQYKSPIPLLQYAGMRLDDVSADSLHRARRRLLVELDLSGQSLQIEGETYTKDDIIAQLDALKTSNHLVLHDLIYRHKRLYHFLTTGQIGGNEPLYDANLKYHPGFETLATFISPYLVAPLSKGLHQAFLSRDFSQADVLLNLAGLVIAAHRDEVFGKLRHAMASLIADVRELIQQPDRFTPGFFGFLSVPFIQFLNNLPEDLQATRDTLAQVLVNLSVDIRNTQLASCKLLYSHLINLKCREDIAKVIRENQLIFQSATAGRAQQTYQAPKTTKTPTMQIVAFAIVTVIVLFKLIGRINRHPSYHSYPSADRSTYVPPRPAITREDVAYTNFYNRLKRLTYEQLTPRKAVSWLHPVKDDTTSRIYPFSSKARNLAYHNPLGGQRVMFYNVSKYDVVLLVHGEEGFYTAMLKKRARHGYLVENKDEITFYIGNDWTDQLYFNDYRIGSDLKTDSAMHIRGVFTQVDKTSLEYVSRVYVFNFPISNDTSDPGIVLRSSDEAPFDVGLTAPILGLQKNDD